MIKRCLQALALVWMHSALALGTGSLRVHGRTGAGRYSAWRAAAAQVLSRRGDADSLAAAAALCFVASGAKARADPAAGKRAVDLAAKASELDPTDPSIGWLRLQLCAGTAGCDIRDAATTMRWVDADNGAVWLATLAAAQKDKDPAEVDRILRTWPRARASTSIGIRPSCSCSMRLKRASSDLPPHYLPSDLAG